MLACFLIGVFWGGVCALRHPPETFRKFQMLLLTASRPMDSAAET
jgi:hypothetical protein